MRDVISRAEMHICTFSNKFRLRGSVGLELARSSVFVACGSRDGRYGRKAWMPVVDFGDASNCRSFIGIVGVRDWRCTGWALRTRPPYAVGHGDGGVSGASFRYGTYRIDIACRDSGEWTGRCGSRALGRRVHPACSRHGPRPPFPVAFSAWFDAPPLPLSPHSSQSE